MCLLVCVNSIPLGDGWNSMFFQKTHPILHLCPNLDFCTKTRTLTVTYHYPSQDQVYHQNLRDRRVVLTITVISHVSAMKMSAGCSTVPGSSRAMMASKQVYFQKTAPVYEPYQGWEQSTVPVAELAMEISSLEMPCSCVTWKKEHSSSPDYSHEPNPEKQSSSFKQNPPAL